MKYTKLATSTNYIVESMKISCNSDMAKMQMNTSILLQNQV